MQDLANAGKAEGDDAHVVIIEELISYLHERKIVCYSPRVVPMSYLVAQRRWILPMRLDLPSGTLLRVLTLIISMVSLG